MTRTPHPILVTSQPKNGTHLLLNTLAQIPGLSEHHLHHINWGRKDAIFSQLETLKSGEFTKSHLIYSGQANLFLRKHNFVVFNMIRDPRDNLVSLLFYLKKTTDHRLHQTFMERFTNDNERLMALIEGFHFNMDGKKDKINSIDKPIMNWWKWNECDYCLPVHFEHLVGEKGGGNRQLQEEEIKKILLHLSIKPHNHLVSSIADNCYNPNTYSFRKGQIGGWKQSFTKAHKQAFKTLANNALLHYGYESNSDW